MNTRQAFTLVELLTVIAIISILAAIITVAVTGVMHSTHVSRIGMEMSQIAMALDRYRAEIGEFPPDLFDDEALVRHVRKRWPRFTIPGNDTASQAAFIRAAINTAYNAIPNIGVVPGRTEVNFSNLHQPQIGALALWLGGFPNSDGIMSGFSADPQNPFFLAPPPYNTVLPADRNYDGKVFINLELGDNKKVRMFSVGNGAIVPVIGSEIRGVFVPIAYFRGSAVGGPGAYDPNVQRFIFPDFGLCIPYKETEVRWYNPTTFQLIHPGLDGKFGSAGERIIRPNDPARNSGINLEDLDNITNFSDNRELRGILP